MPEPSARGRRRLAMAVIRCLLLVAVATASPAASRQPQGLHGGLHWELGRNETRVTSAAFELPVGVTPDRMRLPERLEQLGYRRVRGRRPEAVGGYFWGTERFWIHRRPHRVAGRRVPALLFEVRLDAEGRVSSFADAGGEELDVEEVLLDPLLLGESLGRPRARRIPVDLDRLPERVWRPVLAAEDARFFDHPGVDSRSVARALLANLREGEVAQGGSTITQQLIKVRDLSPRRTLGRKVSEAVRALALEAEYDKREILASYLDSIYLGQMEGVAIVGLGAASRAFFGKDAVDLTLGEASLLAGVIQSPNRLSPARHLPAALERREYVLSRMLELGWASEEEVESAREQPRLSLHPPEPMMSNALRSAIRAELEDGPRRRLEEGRGLLVQTTLDPLLQQRATELMRRRGRSSGVEGAFLAGDTRDGRIVALVGSAGDGRSELDRTTRARRQPGSTVKPFVVLEALAGCGAEDRLTLATRVADRRLVLELPTGRWSPANSDGRSHGVVDVRRALTESLNVPTVRIARHCGFDDVARRFRRLGLPGAREEQPAFTLGSVETSPRQLLGAYAHLAPKRFPRRPEVLLSSVASPDGDILQRGRTGPLILRRPLPEVRHLLRQALSDAARSAGVGVRGAWGKTGTSSERRDAWFAGGVGDWVAVLWLGRDDGRPAGLSGGGDAAPIWGAWMEDARALAAGTEAEEAVARAQQRLRHEWIDPETGLVVDGDRPGAEQEWFVGGTVPKKRRWWRPGAAAEVIE